jgi:hypothetical protein
MNATCSPKCDARMRQTEAVHGSNKNFGKNRRLWLPHTGKALDRHVPAASTALDKQETIQAMFGSLLTLLALVALIFVGMVGDTTVIRGLAKFTATGMLFPGAVALLDLLGLRKNCES